MTWLWVKLQAFFWKLLTPTRFRGRLSRLLWGVLDRARDPVVHPLHPVDVSRRLRLARYRSDGLWGFFDRNTHPGAIERSYNAAGGVPVKIGDCDDFAIWAAHMLAPVYVPQLLSTAYAAKEGRFRWVFRGHQVCLFQWRGAYYHVGNYAGGSPFGPYKSVQALYEDMMDWRDRGAETRPVGWVVFTKDLSERVQKSTLVSGEVLSRKRTF